MIQRAIAGLCTVAALCLVFAGSVSPSRAGMEALEERVVEAVLENGMRVLVLPRRQSPTVSLQMRFLVGSAQEEAGRSGMAHLLEHMMFKGTRTLGTRDFSREQPLLAEVERRAALLDTERRRGTAADPDRLDRLRADLREAQAEARRWVVKDEIDSIYTAAGARSFNAATGADLTTYMVSLPSGRLELWARIESDRLADPVMREFYAERDVVMEERRQRFDTDPSRRLFALLAATAFQAHPYRRPVIGWEGDVSFLRAGEASDFYRTYYSPGNTVLAAVGDVDPESFIDLVRTRFGHLPARPLPPDRATPEPAQEGERRAVLEMDANPLIMMAFHKPALPDRDDYRLDLVEGVLAGGRSSRLYRGLVEEGEIALSVTAGNGFPGSRYPNLFVITAVPRAPHSAAEVEAAVREELGRLSREAPSMDEIQGVRNRMKTGLFRSLTSNEGLAGILSYYEAVAGDWRYFTEYLEVLDGISPDEIRETAARYFRDDNRTVVTLVRRHSDGGVKR